MLESCFRFVAFCKKNIILLIKYLTDAVTLHIEKEKKYINNIITFKFSNIMKSLRVMAAIMAVALVSVSMVACGGQKNEAPAAEAEAPVVEAPAANDSCANDSCCAAADSCCANDSCCAAADSCCNK